MFDGLDYVYEVYTEKSFSAAAKKLFISQPALSTAVKKVEKLLGVTIFDRSTTPVSLTPEGRICIDSIERMRAIECSMRSQLKDISDMKTGKITVSGENFISSFILPDIIIEFMNRYPGMEVELVESNTHDLMRCLADEEIDILVAHEFSPEEFISRPLTDETLLLAVPGSYEINSVFEDRALSFDDIAQGRHLKEDCPDVSLADFAQEKMLMLKKGNDMYERVRRLCADAGIEPAAEIYPDQLLTAWNMCKAGLGCTVVTDNLILSGGGSKRCRLYKLRGENTHRTLCIGCKKKGYIPRSVEAFMSCAEELYSERKEK